MVRQAICLQRCCECLPTSTARPRGRDSARTRMLNPIGRAAHGRIPEGIRTSTRRWRACCSISRLCRMVHARWPTSVPRFPCWASRRHSRISGMDRASQRFPTWAPRASGSFSSTLDSGASPTVERAIAESGQTDAITAHRALRSDFISQATAEAVLSAPARGLVGLNEYRGDFQMHSTWSDGGQTLEHIIQASLALGRTCAGVTDHGYGLPIAHGMSMEAAARQHAAIDALNAHHRGR